MQESVFFKKEFFMLLLRMLLLILFCVHHVNFGSITIQNEEDDTKYFTCFESHDLTLAMLQKEKDFSPITEEESISKFETIFKEKDKVNWYCDHANLPLHEACMLGKPFAIEWLLKNGARLDIANKYGNYPTHCVRDKNTINFLMQKYSVDINEKNVNGKTLLDIVIGKLRLSREESEWNRMSFTYQHQSYSEWHKEHTERHNLLASFHTYLKSIGAKYGLELESN